ncbi:MAG: porin, partial [Opitutales bacterium]|nr:porin [Opitutales bacterium]
ALGNGDVITAGRYASMLGFEAFEPTGLYQYSTAYSMSGLPGYAQGVKYTRESDTSFFGISIQDEAFNNGANSLGGNNNDGSYAVELAYSQVLGNGIAVFLGGAYEDGDALGDTYIINAYTTYETGAWLFAAEVNFFKSENILFSFTGADVDVLSGLLMANYAYSDTASVTARVSYEEVDENGAVDEFIKYTLAHNKALAENLALIVEVSYSEFDLDGNTDDADALELAVELLFTF